MGVLRMRGRDYERLLSDGVPLRYCKNDGVCQRKPTYLEGSGAGRFKEVP